MEKKCIICGETKPYEQIVNQAKSKDGKGSYCRDCARAKAKKWREDNLDKKNAYRKQYMAERPGLEKKWRQAWRAKNRDRAIELQRNFAAKNPERTLYYEAKKRAKRRGTPFTIVWQDIKIPETCPVLGIKLERGVGRLSDASPTVDAIIPSKGYTPDNIAVISHRANRIKTDATLEEIGMVYGWLKDLDRLSF